MTDADGDQNGCGGAFTLALEISENPKLPGGGKRRSGVGETEIRNARKGMRPRARWKERQREKEMVRNSPYFSAGVCRVSSPARARAFLTDMCIGMNPTREDSWGEGVSLSKKAQNTADFLLLTDLLTG